MSALKFIVFFLILYSTDQAYPGKIVKFFDSPGKFSTGMTFDGKNLWVADYKSDKIFKVDTSDGKVIAGISSPGFWPKGLAFDGQNLWNIDCQQKKIFKIDPEDGKILHSIDAPSDNPEGLAWDGVTLWVSDSRARKIMKIDLSDGTAVITYDSPATYPKDLTFDGEYLWCSDRREDEIYMIDPSNGEVIIITKSPGPYPRGLAFDGIFLWNVDYQNDIIYKLGREDSEIFHLSNTRKASVTFTHEVKINGNGIIKNLDTYIAVPENMPQQKINSVKFYPDEFEVSEDRWNQRVAHFNFRDKNSSDLMQSVMEVNAEISEINYFIFPHKCGGLEDIPDTLRLRYTADGTKYLTVDPYIRNLDENIIGNETNPYWMARKIFDFVRNTLEYKLEGGWNTAPFVLQRGTGSCSEYTFSFISLCRAAGIPARYVGAIVVRGDDASLDDVFHRWPEIYLPNYGWIPMDPQGGDKPLPRDRARNIGGLANRFLITTQGGGDSEYLGWYYNYNQSYQTDPKVQVNIETFGEWEPLTD